MPCLVISGKPKPVRKYMSAPYTSAEFERLFSNSDVVNNPCKKLSEMPRKFCFSSLNNDWYTFFHVVMTNAKTSPEHAKHVLGFLSVQLCQNCVTALYDRTFSSSSWLSSKMVANRDE